MGCSLGVKRPVREADHSPQASAEIKNAWSHTSTPQFAFKAWCSVKQHRDNFTFYYMEVTDQLHDLAESSPEKKKPSVPTEQKVGWAPEPVWSSEKFLPLPGTEHRSFIP
jgi:hypothetical protein